MAAKKNKVKVLQQIVDPVTLTNLGYREVEVDEADAPAASLVKHIAGASFDDSAETQATSSGRTVSSEESRRLTAVAEETEAANEERVEADAKRQEEADARAEELGIGSADPTVPTVGQVKAEQKAKAKK